VKRLLRRIATRDEARRWALRTRARLSGYRWPVFGRRLAPFSRRYGYDRGTPVDRYYIAAFLSRHRTFEGYAAGDLRGVALEVGGDDYARAFGGAIERLDVLHATADNPQATIVGDLATGEGLSPEVYDCVICTQTLNSIYDVHGAVATLHRILKPGGVALVTVPGIAGAVAPDRYLWGDYWRFTTGSLRRLFEASFDAGGIEIEGFGNLLSTTAYLHGLAAEELSPAQLDCHDPAYELLLTVRARRSAPDRARSAGPSAPGSPAG
jgi:SAM-dependent methyltransferase